VEAVPAAILRLTARLVAAPRPAPEPPDELLTPAEVARMVKADVRWLESRR